MVVDQTLPWEQVKPKARMKPKTKVKLTWERIPAGEVGGDQPTLPWEQVKTETRMKPKTKSKIDLGEDSSRRRRW